MGAELSLPRRALSVEDYHRMGETGLFRPEERIELIEGDLITMAPIGGLHLHVVSALAQLLSLAVQRSAFVSVQNPVSLPPDSEPQPDIALLAAGFWQRSELPTAEDVLLVVEVADTTVARDEQVKIPLYARHGITEAWLVDLSSERVLVCRDPVPQGYRTIVPAARDAALSPVSRPDVTIHLLEIWPHKSG